MKIVSSVALAAMLCTMATACSLSGVGDDPDVSPTAEPGISVDEKLFYVDVTLPASFFNDMSSEEIQAKALESGYEAEIAEDGTVTYTIPKPLHEKLISDLGVNIDGSIAETLASESSVKDIVHDSKFTSFKMTVDRATFDGSFSASLIPLSLGFQAMFYQAFDGVVESERRVVVSYVDVTTGKEFDTYVLPDALE